VRIPNGWEKHIIDGPLEVIYFRHLIDSRERELLPTHIPILPHITAVKHNPRAVGKNQGTVSKLRKKVERTISKDNPNDRLDIISKPRLNGCHVRRLHSCGANTGFSVEDEQERGLSTPSPRDHDELP
jgi:hypothetical protein